MPLRVLDLRTAPGVRHAGAEVPLPLEEDVLVDMSLSQNPLPSLPCVHQQQKGPSDDAKDATCGNEDIEAEGGTLGCAVGWEAAGDGDVGMTEVQERPSGPAKT